MMRTTGKNRIDTVFVLLIFSVFALSVLMVLMLGARIYKNMTDITRQGQDERTLLSYVWTKVKNGDKAGCIYAGDFSGQSALYFDEEIEGTYYRTAIYQYDGWVYEMFCDIELFNETRAEYLLLPEDGVRVMEIDDLRFEDTEYGLIRVSTGASSMLLYPRSSPQS